MTICYTVREMWRVTDVIVTFHFGLFFVFLPPLTAWKMKISIKWKKSLEMSSFYTSIPKIVIIWYTVPEIRRVIDVIVIFNFGLFFALLPPNLPKKRKKFLKNEISTWRYHHFTQSVLKIMIICYTVPEIWRVTNVTDRRTDGRTEKVTHRGGWPT